jgi:hypothetical protein
MPVAIGLRTAHSAPWDGAIIDIAAVSMTLDGEVTGEYHEYVQPDGFRAYRPVALKVAGLNFDYLDEHGTEELAAVLGWLDWVEKYHGFSSCWVGGAEGFDSSEQVTFLQKRMQGLDRHRGIPRILTVESVTLALAELGLAPGSAGATAHTAKKWVGYEAPSGKDDALVRAKAAARTACTLTAHLADLRSAVAGVLN